METDLEDIKMKMGLYKDGPNIGFQKAKNMKENF
jgi:hypothetical protein